MSMEQGTKLEPSDMPRKPRLLFFQCLHDSLPDFLRQHARDHVRCLSEFFEVTVVNSDGDYLEACERHEPDLALFELGVNHPSCRRPRLTNLRACPAVPKVALHNADAFCNARAGLLSDVDHYDVSAVFAISTTAAEHTPELADRFFVWPNSIDPGIYRDYGQYKSIPILLTGNKGALYPWRQRVTGTLIARYPVLNCPHPGYEPEAFRGLVLTGESYARTINASSFVPACGTVAREVVRKHFEIPGSRACLVTERSPSLEAAGFVDMQNCVFAEPEDIVDKIDHLLTNPPELQRITDEGHQLVHSRHTPKNRSEILQWFELNRRLQPGGKIVQPGPFAPLRVVPDTAADSASHWHVEGRGLHLQLIEEGDRLFEAGDIAGAEQKFSTCTNYMPWMPEPRLRLARCRLLTGRPTEALAEIKPLLAFILGSYKAIDADPVEWATYILCLLCLGRDKAAARRARQFNWVHHPELDRARWLASVLTGEQLDVPAESDPSYRRRRTIHVIPSQDFPGWRRYVTAALNACGRDRAAARIEGLEGAPMSSLQAGSARGQPAVAFSPNDELLDVDRRAWVSRRIRPLASRTLDRLESSLGSFLPFRLSKLRKDAFFARIRDVAGEPKIGNVLLVGAAVGNPCTEALLSGALSNQDTPAVYCYADSSRRLAKLRQSLAAHPSLRWTVMPRLGVRGPADWLYDSIGRMMADNGIAAFDLVVLDGPCGGQLQAVRQRGLPSWLIGSGYVFLHGINLEPNWSRHQRLLRSPEMSLVHIDAGLRNGYSIFKRRSTRSPR